MTHTLKTSITEMFGIKYPVILAGMNAVASPELAAAVTNAGGMGVIGGVGYTPQFLRDQIRAIKDGLDDKNAPFGVDLLLPAVGGSARKTNYDYTKGALPELVDIIIEEGAKLFVCAVGVPPKWAVDKFHAAGIYCMNMIGAPKHVAKACAVGVDIICAQGSEGGGHTGDVMTSILIPKVVDLCQQYTSPLTGKPVQVVAAGGIFDGRGLAMSISLGAEAVWVGTRFICAEESGAPPRHKKAVIGAGYNDTVRSIIFTGRPMRVLKTPYIMDWQENKSDEIRRLTSQGILPAIKDQEDNADKYGKLPLKERMDMRPLLMGAAVGAISETKPAKEIVETMVSGAVELLQRGSAMVSRL